MYKRVAALALLLLMNACTRNSGLPEDPKRRLTEYISRSFAVKGVDDRKALLEFLTGDAKGRLAAWSDDQFRVAFIDSKRAFVKLAFKESKEITPEKVDLTYELTYLNQAQGKDTKVTNKKLCQMVLEKEHWMISDVQNIKELVEYHHEMSLP